MKNVFKIIRNVVLICLAVFLAATLISALLHATYFRNKYEQVQPYGELIDVFDGKMHITRSGEGNTTIVLLPGLGEGLTCADFAPLVRNLSKDYHVVCVDYFGGGFSTETVRERTAENYVEEIREVLHNAGIEGPYVLMPHSVSGLYCEYYASCYPEEVKAIISLDTTSTAERFPLADSMKPLQSAYLNFMRFTGAELNTILTTDKKQMVNEGGYTEKEVDDLIIYCSFAVNDDMIETMLNTNSLIDEVMAQDFSKEVPYYKIIARESFERIGEQYHMDHLARVGAEDSYCILDGAHTIYRTSSEEIGRITREFLAGIE